jgi:hypothetical protein
VSSGDRGTLAELHSLLESEGGLLAAALQEGAVGEVFAPLVSAGPRSSADPSGYAIVVESILEGYLLHYARGRFVDDPDPDLRLLAGDHLYAFGLVRLAGIGDLDAVDELSDLIGLCAQAHATARLDDTQSPWQSTQALWANAVIAIAAGPSREQRDAKERARVEGPRVIEKVLDAARDRARELSLESRLERALIAFERTVETNSRPL